MNRQPTVAVGTRPVPRTIGPVTQTDIVRFAGAGGDFNPLHHDPEFARKAGFDKPIAMGQLSAGLLAGWLTDWCGIENLAGLQVRFTAPLAIGATVELSGEVSSLEQDDTGAPIAVVDLLARDGQTPVVTGTAHVRITTG